MPPKRQPDPEPSFEHALGQLEQIVASLERGEPELTIALAKYENAVGLLKLCYRLLDEAEQSVSLLTGVDERGSPRTAPFDATATIARDSIDPPAAPTDRTNDERKSGKTSGRRATPADDAIGDESWEDEGPPF